MDLIVDANILFSAIIRSGKTEELMFEPVLHLYAPEYIFEEFAKYKSVILEKTGRKEDEFNQVLRILKKQIKTISNEETKKFVLKAKKFCPDDKDVDYFAAALALKCPVWSNDKALKQQNVVLVYSTSELLKIFR